MNDYAIRRVEPHEAAIVAEHRLRMFEDMGEVPPTLSDALRQASERALTELLGSGDYVGWFATTRADQIIAGAGVHIKAQLPRVSLTGTGVTSGPVPLVVNVYTDPSWRGRGVARALMQHLMAWATDQGHDRVVLHASPAGRGLYSALGFEATNEMRWVPERADDRHQTPMADPAP